MAPPPAVPRIHRRSNSSTSRDSNATPHHVSNPNMDIDTPHHLQRRSSSRSQRGPHRPSHPTKSSKPRRIPKHSNSYTNYTFQHPRHNMGISLRPSSYRMSFLPSPHPTSASLQALLNDIQNVKGSRITTPSLASVQSSNPCRISPSPGGVRIWELMMRIQSSERRMVCWRGVNGADPWYDPLDDAGNDTADGRANDRGDATRRHRNESQYKSINPYDELAKFPSHSPILTNYKRRLPNRADVGFANPSEKEIQLKMAEVQKECEWQEFSPRVCLLTGFGGHATNNMDAFGKNNDGEVHASQTQLELWTGGSIPDMPYAGRDLIDTYKMYQRFEDQYNHPTSKRPNHHDKDKIKDPRTYSMFAPPLDAQPSKSNIWKPRLFDDRPVCMRYLLACPYELQDENDDEPLFCTMALYLLSTDDSNDATTINLHKTFKGKVSEDFFFPAGNWNAIEGPSEVQSWRRRKRRAVFSYDPLDCEENDLFFVVKVFRVAKCESKIDGENNGNGSQKKDLEIEDTSKELRSKTDTAGKVMYSNDGHIDTSMGEYAPRFLSPVCFSIVPAFPTNDPKQMQQWPGGETMRAPFYAFPDRTETQEDFVSRLSTLSVCQREEYSSLVDGNLRSFAQITKVKNVAPAPGHVDIFISRLGEDFTQALLHEPAELQDISDDHPSTKRPKLLADVMGESAIGFDGANSDDKNTKHMRSKLRRLPPTPASRYTCSFDIKEILYMPPRLSPRKYEEDTGVNATSFLNLIYVYPRLIRITDGAQNNDDVKLSLRVRAVEQELHEKAVDGADAVYQPLQLVYNPSSPAGPPLVESFHTKLAGYKSSDSKAGRCDVHLQDEVKIRLPDVLDRRHFLEFSLVSVKNGFDDSVVAEKTVPFIISSKETTSGRRVTTIIPNGLHRIQLGETYQIHVETRLMSTFHISDASVATILRDYPLTTLIDGSVKQALVPQFVGMLSMTSGQAIKRHFFPLLNINMLGLLNQSCPIFSFKSLFEMFGSDTDWHCLVPTESLDSIVASLRCIFEILEKTRTCFTERDQSIAPIKYQQWIKSFVDSFDEKLFLLHGDHNVDENGQGHCEADASLSSLSIRDNDHLSSSSNSNIPELKSSLSMISRSSAMLNHRLSKKGTARSDVSEVPFSRRAFVATKIEQMQADAELFENGNEYFDDDQTVATYATTTSRMTFATITSRMDRDLSKLSTTWKSKSLLVEGKQSTDGNITSPDYEKPPRWSPSNDFSSSPFSFASKRAEYMANRVNIMAQLVIAPCIAPSVKEVNQNGPNLVSSAAADRTSEHYTPNSTLQSNKHPVEPGSDGDEEGQTKNFISLRGNQSCLNIPPLEFNLMSDSSERADLSPWFYELVSALWVHSWTVFASQVKGENHMRGSSATIPNWPYKAIEGTSNPSVEEKTATSFIRNIAFFLPLMLKSLAIRCSKHQTTQLVVPMTFLDNSHMQVLVPLIETIALGTMKEAMSGSSGGSNAEHMLAKALSVTEYSSSFFIGTFACLHPSQVSTLINAYFNILVECEQPGGRGSRSVIFTDRQSIRRIKCSKLIRLHVVEKLAVMPKFIALNYPPKFTGYCPPKSVASSSWCHQSINNVPDNMYSYSEKINRYPQSFWLSDLLMDQCLSISIRCCEAIIIEAKAQLKASKFGNKVLSPLTREDLMGLETTALQAASCAYDVLIKRHAMDSRFQNIENNTRVAALFVEQVLENLVSGISILNGLEPNQKVRSYLVMCLIYVLQESPEVLLREKLRSFCQQDKYRINDFVNLLTTSSVTIQHLMVPSGNVVEITGEKNEEMIQESFNCLSASIILVVDECFDYLIGDADKTNHLAKDVFNVFLHLLSTPQSSVTLLRTLGGAAHAFDKIGASVFMRVVGDGLQHWSRVVLTLMNSTELSVRSMAVDFTVSLLGAVYNDRGSVDDIALVFLTVLPEVAAREIALFNLSGLTKTMDDVEVTLWPIRRAFADIEETSPDDDERVDPQLMPIILTICRTGQAILDSVLVELRLKGFDSYSLLKTMSSLSRNKTSTKDDCLKTLFDADEESVLEAASFFSTETGMPQKIRWLLTLRDLHISKSQWAEAAEALILSANSIIDSMAHITDIWRPWTFNLWKDCRKAPWLSNIGLSTEHSGNEFVMEFAESFLESPGLVQVSTNRFSIETMCSTLSSIVDQAFLSFNQEDGLQDLAYLHFETLLNRISLIITNQDRKLRSNDIALLRRVRGNICTKLARFDKDSNVQSSTSIGHQKYVRIVLRGNKPIRFKESTTIPTYFEWNMPSICRVPISEVSKAKKVAESSPMKSEDECVCTVFAEKYMSALKEAGGISSAILRIGATEEIAADDPTTFLDIAIVQIKQQSRSEMKSRKFYLRNDTNAVVSFGTTEYTVAHKFPHVLSRQRSIANDIMSISNRV